MSTGTKPAKGGRSKTSALDPSDKLRTFQARAYVEEIGALEAELTPHMVKLKRLEALKRNLRALYDSAPPEQIITIRSAHYSAILGQRELRRYIRSMRDVALKLGDRFFDLCKFTLEDLSKELPGDETSLVVYRQDGTRPLVVAQTSQSVHTVK